MGPRITPTRVAIAVLVSSFALVGAHYGYKAYRWRSVRIAAIGPATSAEPYGQRPVDRARSQQRYQIHAKSGDKVRAELSSTALTNEQAREFYSPERAVTVVSAKDVLRELESRTRVSANEREQLVYTFKLAANLQVAIDAIGNVDEQTKRQQDLLEQIDVRLRKIFVDRERIDIAREVLAGLPRIEGES